ncbi:serine protease [Bdellovibrio bacteriovorus]|uniref:trypsin-like serine peptidase n=1 Tax=Bdellovibrio bacteriovorus TaxID=959 RepID=UPI0021CE7411|nr:serine protease [Bdellovibrio bacteriovorus]UXR64545.1 serine protease [Bdellovibrio bacteriovorus]
MKANILKRSLALAAVSILSTGFAPITPMGIYGDDNRSDLYEVQKEEVRAVAASTAALIGKEHLQNNDSNGYYHKGSTLGHEKKLCPEERFIDQPALSDCSGFLVGEDLLVTAGHCILSANSCNSFYFVFDYKMDNAHVGPKFSSYDDVYSCKKIIERKLSDAADYALIRLNRPVKGRKPLRLQARSAQAGDTLYAIGYPSGLPTKVADNATVRTSYSDYFVANLDTFSGNSGSAVFNAETNEVNGILVRGDDDFRYDRARRCNVTNRCPDDSCNGEHITHISFIIKALAKIKSGTSE